MRTNLAPLASRSRTLIAGAALLMTAATVGSVLTLAEHYDQEFLQLAASASASRHAHDTSTPAHAGDMHPTKTAVHA